MTFQTTTDGGVTWTPPLTIPVQSDVPGPELAIRPNGELVVIFLDRGSNLYAIRSTDGAVSFGPREQITAITAQTHPFREDLLRVFPIPTAEADAAGTVYAAWFDCRFRRACSADDAVLVRSTANGWTQPRRIPLVARTSRTDVVLPSLAVDPSRRGRLALTYYTVAPVKCAPAACRLNAWLTTSGDGGSRWTPPRRLNPVPMRFAWLARTSSGRMVGDYFGSVFSGTRAVAIVAIARAPRGGRLNEAIHALSVPVR
jgi:hypothetical protein